MPSIEADKYQRIAVGVVCRKDYILISKRAKHSHQGDLWEFPGGKLEAGETSFQGLYRELDEELGIRIEQAEPLISIPFTYPAKNKQEVGVNVLLEVWRVSNFSGRPYSRENQPIKWVAKKQLADYSFPVANKNILNALLLSNSYVITPDSNLSSEDDIQSFVNRFKQLSTQAYSLIQLRFKKNLLDEYTLQQLAQLAATYQINLQFNSSSNLNYKEDYSHFGIHLTSSDLHSEKAISLRESYYGFFSASCHNENDIIMANALHLDFITLSPVNATTSHPNAQTLGWDRFKQLTSLAQMPVYALGGMHIADIELARQYGAQGIAGISTFWQG